MGLRRVIGQGLDAHAARVHHLEHQFARIHHLPCHGAGRGDHTRHGRHQRIARGQARPHGAQALGQALQLALGCFDVLARHGVRQVLQTCQAACRQVARRAQLGLLGHLVGALDGARRGHHIGQHLALAHRLAHAGQALGPGLQPAGQSGLHLAAGIGVHHHRAGQLEGLGMLPFGSHQGAHAQLALRGLG
ncbi:hypothetical protein D3C71_1428650 [compost metagenome]